MAETQLDAGQQEAADAEVLAEEAVLAAVPAQDVADEGVADVGEMAADLVGAARAGFDADQAVAGFRRAPGA